MGLAFFLDKPHPSFRRRPSIGVGIIPSSRIAASCTEFESENPVPKTARARGAPGATSSRQHTRPDGTAQKRTSVHGRQISHRGSSFGGDLLRRLKCRVARQPVELSILRSVRARGVVVVLVLRGRVVAAPRAVVPGERAAIPPAGDAARGWHCGARQLYHAGSTASARERAPVRSRARGHWRAARGPWCAAPRVKAGGKGGRGRTGRAPAWGPSRGVA